MGKLKRPLFADFKLHAGDDHEFKNELIVLMIANVLELKRAVGSATSAAFDQSRFREVVHKVNTTLVILNDAELTSVVNKVKRGSGNGEKIALLDGLCSQVIGSLQAELEIKDISVVFG